MHESITQTFSYTKPSCTLLSFFVFFRPLKLINTHLRLSYFSRFSLENVFHLYQIHLYPYVIYYMLTVVRIMNMELLRNYYLFLYTREMNTYTFIINI